MSEILDLIHDAVPVRSKLPLATIAKKAGVTYDTAERYMNMILKIQNWDTVHIESIGTQKGYYREGLMGRPPKK